MLCAQTLCGQTSITADVTAETATHNKRPKIAVVLAGGGAKGVAHIAALKAIEDAGLPIDMVVGTSMGSIIGGMYCAGYSPDTMKQIVKRTDWMKLILDNPDYDESTLSGKKDNEYYQLRFLVDKFRFTSGTGLGGVIQGTNVMRFFKSLTWMLPDSLDFSDLPVPFACVATRTEDGQRKVFTEGNLPLSMRASMAIPMAFTPVTIDSTVYIDGGVVDNFPVDVAREMGADIVIGVDLLVNETMEELANSSVDILLHCMDLYSMDRYRQNVKDADIYIPIDVTGYSAASFGAEALDTLMMRGEKYVSLKKPALDSLRQTIDIAEEPVRLRVGDYTFARMGNKDHDKYDNESRESLYKANDGSLTSSINLGARFDNHEFAAIKAKFNVVVSEHHASLLQLQARLGERLEGKLDYSLRSIGTQRIGANYKIQKHDLTLRKDGSKYLSADMLSHRFCIYFEQEWHSKFNYNFGLNYYIYHYNDILYNGDFVPKTSNGTDKMNEKFFLYYFNGEYNSLDYQSLPTKGQRIYLVANFVSDNLLEYKGHTMLPIFSLDWMWAISCNSRLTLQPHLYGRVTITDDVDEPLAVKNVVGGIMNEMHFFQQRTIAGISKPELIDNEGLALAGMSGLYSVMKNHYIQLTGDVFTHASTFGDAFRSQSLNWGAEISYNIRTSLGPLSAKFYWNDFTRRVDFTISAGYNF